MRIAYVLATFPSLSETFILREILALRDKGFEVEIFALRRPLSSAREPDVGDLARFVHYRPRLFSREFAASKTFFMLRSPLKVLRVLGRILFNGWPNPIGLLKTLRNVPAALCFARAVKRLGVKHIHAHFAFVPADVAMIMAELLDLQFTVSAHAWDIYAQNRKAIMGRIKYAATVINCTEHGKRHLREMFPELPDKKFVTIRHGIPIANLQPGDPETGLILAVGRLTEKKGFRYLIEACRLCNERGTRFECQIVGALEKCLVHLDKAFDCKNLRRDCYRGKKPRSLRWW